MVPTRRKLPMIKSNFVLPIAAVLGATGVYMTGFAQTKQAPKQANSTLDEKQSAARAAAAKGPVPVRGFEIGPQRDEIRPGQFFSDAPTLENLGFRWYVEGDSNRNAQVAVAYRKSGETAWKAAQPMLRVHNEITAAKEGIDRAYRTGNLFAGSVLGLQPGTSYEVEFRMSDPDGGAPAPKVVTASTRDELRPWKGGRVIEVFPKGYAGQTSPGAIVGLQKAYDGAQPGDRLMLHGGVYNGPFTFGKKGAPGKPIVVGKWQSERPILDGGGKNLVLMSGSSYQIVQDLTLLNALQAITTAPPGSTWRDGPGASWITVQRCQIEDVKYGIWTMSENSHDWLILDNTITGSNQKWHPRPREGYMDGSNTGVNVYGQGMVVAYNRISRFADALAVANFQDPVKDLKKWPVDIDFYGNDLSFATDDTLETDYSAHNVRVYRNRLANAFTGLSTQPTYGGPIYLIRNELYNITELAFKLNNNPAGVVALHNTSISTAKGLRPPPIWRNSYFYNNLILGATNLALDTGSPTPYSTLDYNGYFGVENNGALFRWNPTGDSAAKNYTSYPTLAAFSRATGLEKHGVMVDFSIFQKGTPPTRGATSTPDQYDLRLRGDSKAVDAGVVISNVNDDFTGAAPDLGAYEVGQPLPHYGPR